MLFSNLLHTRMDSKVFFSKIFIYKLCEVIYMTIPRILNNRILAWKLVRHVFCDLFACQWIDALSTVIINQTSNHNKTPINNLFESTKKGECMLVETYIIWHTYQSKVLTWDKVLVNAETRSSSHKPTKWINVNSDISYSVQIKW